MANSREKNAEETSDCIVNVKKEPEVIDLNDDSESDEICELEHLRKLFIGGLAVHTTEESLKAFYSKWGKVVDVVIMRDSTTKRSRGFGFITFTKSRSVNEAQANRPHVIDGKTVEAKRALPRPERDNVQTNASVKKLFVGGLKDNHDEDCLKEYFAKFGNVISVKILTDRNSGKRRGFAFVEFDDYDAVDKAILQKEHSIKYVIVDVKKSVYKQEKEKRNTMQMSQNNGKIEGPPMQNRNNMKTPAPAPPQQNGGYQMPPTPQPRMLYPQAPPIMNGPPPNNYWGPPPPVPQGYGNNYQQPPPPAPVNNWNAWNAAPPPQAANWQQNQWGYQAGPPPAPIPNNWNAHIPPPGTHVPANVPPPQIQPPPQPPMAAPPQNFGTGYQQNYGGGPVKHNGSNPQRMNPYSVPPNNGQHVQPAPYGYVAPVPTNAVPPVAPVPPVGSKYRR